MTVKGKFSLYSLRTQCREAGMRTGYWALTWFGQKRVREEVAVACNADLRLVSNAFRDIAREELGIARPARKPTAADMDHILTALASFRAEWRARGESASVETLLTSLRHLLPAEMK